MKDKITYHLANLLEELKQILSEEISHTLKKSLNQPLANEQDVYLTIDELASNFKISKSLINKLRKKYKNFPVLNIDSSVRFKQSEVEKFFTGLTNNSV